MLSYTYVTASCPPLRDGIESTSKSILVVPLYALPSLANSREARVSRASSPYRQGLPEHGRSILARRVIRRRPFCVICLEPLDARLVPVIERRERRPRSRQACLVSETRATGLIAREVAGRAELDRDGGQRPDPAVLDQRPAAVGRLRASSAALRDAAVAHRPLVTAPTPGDAGGRR
jgi:hypothetical protein